MATAEEVEREWDEKLAEYNFTLQEKRDLCADVMNYRIRQDSGDWYVGSLATVRVCRILGISYPSELIEHHIGKASEKTIEELYDYLKYYIIVMVEHRGRKRLTGATIIFWPNGNTSCTDKNAQVPKMQVSWIQLYFQFLEEHGVDPTKQTFILPDGMEAIPFVIDRGEYKGHYNWKVQPRRK